MPSDRVLWACDRCGAVYYRDERPTVCNSCHGQHPDAGGGRTHPDNHITFSRVSDDAA